MKTEKLTSSGRDLKTKMPADTLGNSISTFLNKTDQISQKYRSAQIENEMTEDRWATVVFSYQNIAFYMSVLTIWCPHLHF